MANVMLSIAAELAPRSKRPRGPQGWCADPSVQAEMNAAWLQREEARRSLRVDSNNGILRKAVKTAGKNLEKVRKTGMASFFWAHVRKPEASVREGDHAGFYRCLKTMNLERKRDHNSQFIKGEHSSMLRDVEIIRERWVRWFHTLLNTMSPKLDPRRPRAVAQEHDAGKSAYNTGADRCHPLFSKRKGCWTRWSSRRAVQDRPKR